MKGIIAAILLVLFGASCGTSSAPTNQTPVSTNTVVVEQVKSDVAWKDVSATIGLELPQWVAFQQKNDRVFTLDGFSLVRTLRLEAPTWELERADLNPIRDILQKISPNHEQIADPYIYMDVVREGSRLRVTSDVDRAVRILHPKENTKQQVLLCGSICSYDDAAWMDDEVLIVVGISEDVRSSDTPTGRYAVTVDVVDLKDGTVASYARAAAKRPGSYLQERYPILLWPGTTGGSSN